MQSQKLQTTAKYETVDSLESKSKDGLVKRVRTLEKRLASFKNVFDSPDKEVVYKSAIEESGKFGLFEPGVYDVVKGEVTVPINAGHYEVIHSLCAGLGVSEADVLQGILESGIEGGLKGHASRGLVQAFEAIFRDGESRDSYPLHWAKQRTKELAETENANA